MRRVLLVLATTASLSVAAAMSGGNDAVQAEVIDARAIYVVDGDTIDVNGARSAIRQQRGCVT